MKRIIFFLLALVICATQIEAATPSGGSPVDRALADARKMLSQASTPAACDKAAAKFNSVRSVPGYNKARHESSISNGVAQCNSKKKRLQNGAGSGGSSSGGNKKPTPATSPDRRPSTSPSPSSSSPQQLARSLVVTDVSFCNTDVEKNIISGPSNVFFADEVQYICPKIYYEGLSTATTVTFDIKFYDPDGALFAHTGKTYTFSCDNRLYSGYNSELLEGWGNSDGGVYYDGEWKCEIWAYGRKLHTSTFEIVGNNSGSSGSGDSGPDYASGRYVKINKVSTGLNEYKDGQKGMYIYSDFDAVGMKGHKVYVAAYFYYSDGTPLKDTDGEFSTNDGQVCVWDRETVNYDSSNFSNFRLFIPYSQLHVRDAELKFYVRVEDDTMDDKTQLSEWQYITLGNP